MPKCSDCDWGSCIGCPHDNSKPYNPWDDPNYPEYDPSDDLDFDIK